MDFSQKYKPGQKLFLVVQGEGTYLVTIEKYGKTAYHTNHTWYISPESIVFDTQGEMDDYLKEHPLVIDRGCSEWGYASRASYADFDY